MPKPRKTKRVQMNEGWRRGLIPVTFPPELKARIEADAKAEMLYRTVFVRRIVARYYAELDAAREREAASA